jgi:hypothetical protein
MIGPLDLLADRPERLLGRGGPRLLRYASSVVLAALLGSIGVAAAAAVRVPSWTDDTTAVDVDGILEAPMASSEGLRHSDLVLLLQAVETLDGVQLEHVDVRSAGYPDTDARRSGGVSDLLVQVSVASTEAVDVRDVLASMMHPAVHAVDVDDYRLTPSGAVASITMLVRSDTGRRDTSAPDEEPTRAIPALVRAAGAEVLSVRLPGPDALGQQVLLSSIGPIEAIVRVLSRIESGVSSTGRIGSLTLRRNDDGRVVLDLVFTLRERIDAMPSAT